DLEAILKFTLEGFEDIPLEPGTVEQVRDFIYERYRNQLGKEFDRRVVDAVIALQPPLEQIEARIRACADFARLPDAESLAAANKRITNLLKKAEGATRPLQTSLLVEPAEQDLAQRLHGLAPRA